jgi:DNA-directed RNA polymerase III subunit RPC6
MSVWLTGIWTADLKKRTNLQQPQVNKALKNLESRSLVKAVKTVTV